jgi:hypothetical protein
VFKSHRLKGFIKHLFSGLSLLEVVTGHGRAHSGQVLAELCVKGVSFEEINSNSLAVFKGVALDIVDEKTSDIGVLSSLEDFLLLGIIELKVSDSICKHL